LFFFDKRIFIDYRLFHQQSRVTRKSFKFSNVPKVNSITNKMFPVNESKTKILMLLGQYELSVTKKQKLPMHLW